MQYCSTHNSQCHTHVTDQAGENKAFDAWCMSINNYPWCMSFSAFSTKMYNNLACVDSWLIQCSIVWWESKDYDHSMLFDGILPSHCPISPSSCFHISCPALIYSSTILHFHSHHQHRLLCAKETVFYSC